MNYIFENIVPWDGSKDTGRDVRLKWERNFQKIADNFLEVGKDGEAVFEMLAELEKNTKKWFLRKDSEDTAAEKITFNKGAIFFSELSPAQLKNYFSQAITEDNGLDDIDGTIEEGEETDLLSQSIVEETSVPGFESGSLGSIGNVSSAVDSAPDGSVLVKASNAWVAAAAPSGGGSDNIIVDTTYGTFNNPDKKEETATLLVCKRGTELSAIGVTSSGKPIVARSYQVGASGSGIREMACLTSLKLVVAARDSVINAGNLTNIAGSTLITCEVDNISYVDIHINQKSFFIACDMFDSDLSRLNILDESNADIKDLFIPATTNGQHHLYINCLIPIDKIRLKLNTKDELI